MAQIDECSICLKKIRVIWNSGLKNMACHGNSTDMSCFCLHILYCTVLYPVTAWLGYDATIQIIFGRVSSPVEEYYIRIANFFSLSKFCLIGILMFWSHFSAWLFQICSPFLGINNYCTFWSNFTTDHNIIQYVLSQNAPIVLLLLHTIDTATCTAFSSGPHIVF